MRDDPRLIDEQIDHAGTLGEVGQQALDHHESVEAGETALARQKDLAHSADREPLEQLVLPEATHAASGPMRHRA